MKTSAVLFVVPVLLAALLLAACSSSSVTTTGTPPVPTTPPATGQPGDLQEILNQVEQEVARLRNLELLETVDRAFMTRADLETFLIDRLERDDREDIDATQKVFSVLGLIPRETNLFQLHVDLLTEQVLGLFDLETEKLFVIGESDELGPVEETTLAHELVHALQQQHFDIEELRNAVEDDIDAAMAMAALIEGDATLLFTSYALNNLTGAELGKILALGESSPAFDAAPYIIRKDLTFQYDEGLPFVTALVAAGGLDAIDEAFNDPPVSTEQILHLDKYLAREQPVIVSMPDLAGSLGQGWTLVYDEVAGEGFLRTYLETAVPQDVAVAAAAGWGGGRLQLSEGPAGEQVLVMLTDWDTVADAQEFFDVSLSPISGQPGLPFAGLQDDDVLLMVVSSPDLLSPVRSLFIGY